MRFHKEPAEDFACSESSFFQAYKKTVTEDIVAQRSSTAQLRKLCRGFVQPSWLPWIASDPMSLRILPQQRFQVWWSRCPPSISIRLDMWLYTIYCRRSGLCRREEIEHSAPPLQLANLSTFRSLLFKYKRKAWLRVTKSVVLFLEVWFSYTSFGTEHGNFLGTGPREIREGSGTVSCRHFVKLT